MKFVICILISLISLNCAAKEWLNSTKVISFQVYSSGVFLEINPIILGGNNCLNSKKYSLIKLKLSNSQFDALAMNLLLEAKKNNLQTSFLITECFNDYLLAEAISIK